MDTNERNLSPFPLRLTEERLAIPIGMDAVAIATGVPKSSICNVERHLTLPRLIPAARLAKLLGMNDMLRDFHTINRIVYKRDDLRADNPGTNGYNMPEQLHRPTAITEDANRLALRRFAEMCEPLLDAKQWTTERLAMEAGLNHRLVAMIFNSHRGRVGIGACANIAHVLGCNVRLVDFLDDPNIPTVKAEKCVN